MSKIYLPTEYAFNSCKVVNNGYIRVYTNSNNTEWTDIYINQDYQLKPGYSNYSQNVICDSVNEYTDNIWYRTDIDKIMIIFGIMFCLLWKLCSQFYIALFKGPRRL